MLLAGLYNFHLTASCNRLHETLPTLLLPPYLHRSLLPTHLPSSHPSYYWLDIVFLLWLCVRLWFEFLCQLGITRRHCAELPLRFPSNDRLYRSRFRFRPHHPHHPTSLDMEASNAHYEEDPGLWYLPVGEFRGCCCATAHGDLHPTKYTVKYVFTKPPYLELQPTNSIQMLSIKRISWACPRMISSG
jgi:hypothetical protein